jgi:signal transduction histidine kinase
VSVGGWGADVTVTDDGPGPSGASRHGYGLVGIAERVHRLGGDVTFGTGPGGTGFRVAAQLPATAEAPA